MRDQDMRGGLAQAAHDYVRDVAANVWSVTVAAEDHAAAMRAEAEDVTSGDVYVALAWAVVDAARDAAVDAVSDAVAAAFPAVAVYVAAANGLAADAVAVEWPTDTDAAEDAGFVVPVAAYYAGGDYGRPDAWAVVDAYGSDTWPDDLAAALAADLADQVAAI
jgi:hypothetical protein